MGFSWPGMDRTPYCRGSTEGVRGELPSFPDRSYSQAVSLESTETGTACPPERRGGYQALEGGTLASVEKKAAEEARKVVFVDETGCYLLPSVVRTFAPTGQTPVLREKLSREHLSAISGITPEGQLLTKVQDHSFHGDGAVSFLKHLVRRVSEKLLVVWDGNRIHSSNEVREFLASEEGKGVWLERLPAYAPDLNPDEGIWNYLKHVELKNVVCLHLEQLFTEFRRAVQRLRQKPRIIRACFAEAGLV